MTPRGAGSAGPDDSGREERRAAATERTQELQATHRRLAERHADVEERAAEVHDEMARVHEQLGAQSLLDPAQLTAHAQADRERAARERRRAAGEPEPPPA